MKNRVLKQEIPEAFKDSEKWKWSRRRFFKSIMMAGLATQVSFIQACIEDDSLIAPLTNKQYTSLKIVQQILFPKDELGPGALEVHADKYILWVLNDKRMDPEENAYFINGLNWLDEDSIEQYGKSFHRLKAEEQIKMIDILQKGDWGESWLSVNLTYIFEAMLSDPVYGFNDLEQGWKWLDHTAGMPRPDENLKYDSIFDTIKRNS